MSFTISDVSINVNSAGFTALIPESKGWYYDPITTFSSTIGFASVAVDSSNYVYFIQGDSTNASSIMWHTTDANGSDFIQRLWLTNQSTYILTNVYPAGVYLERSNTSTIASDIYVCFVTKDATANSSVLDIYKYTNGGTLTWQKQFVSGSTSYDFGSMRYNQVSVDHTGISMLAPGGAIFKTNTTGTSTIRTVISGMTAQFIRAICARENFTYAIVDHNPSTGLFGEYIIQHNSALVQQWKIYIQANGGGILQLSSIDIDNNSNIILAGRSTLPLPTYVVVRLNSTGTAISWMVNVSNCTGNGFSSVHYSKSQSAIYVAGQLNSNTVLVMKLNLSGTVLWKKYLSGLYTSDYYDVTVYTGLTDTNNYYLTVGLGGLFKLPADGSSVFGLYCNYQKATNTVTNNITATLSAGTATVSSTTTSISSNITNYTPTQTNNTYSPTITLGYNSVPLAPYISSVVQSGLGAIVTFDAPQDLGSAPVTSYTLRCYNGTTPISISPSTVTTTAPVRVTTTNGLTIGTTYNFTVSAINSFGSSKESTVSSLTMTPVTGQVVFTPSLTGTSSTWTVPEGVTSISVFAVGAGGAGANQSGTGIAGKGGAGGSTTQVSGVRVHPGQVFNIEVGAGAAAGTTTAPPTSGSNSFMTLSNYTSNPLFNILPSQSGGYASVTAVTGTRYGPATTATCSGTASYTQNGTTLTVTQVLSGTLYPGDKLTSIQFTTGAYIVQQLTGTTGGAGTYQMSAVAVLSGTNVSFSVPWVYTSSGSFAGGSGGTALAPTTGGGGGGGGAGGYRGVGGTGGSYNGAIAATAGGGGGGGGGIGQTGNGYGGGGGGVGLLGEGTSGTVGTSTAGGGGGSGGTDGGAPGASGPDGGTYGGGGGGAGTKVTSGNNKIGGKGGDGAIRIIWPGDTRTYNPSANTDDLPSNTYP